MKLKGALLAVTVALAGCASTAPHYYSLQAIEDSPPAAPVQGAYAISVQPVVIPQQVARPQVVVRMAPGSEVVPLASALWVGPLEDQIRLSLAAELTRRLGVLDVGSARIDNNLPVWQIYVDVQRFDAVYGQQVQQEIVWRMVPQGIPGKPAPRVCAAQAALPVQQGMGALVEGHRQALAGIAQAMTRALETGAKKGRGALNDGVAALPDGVHFRGCTG